MTTTEGRGINVLRGVCCGARTEVEEPNRAGSIKVRGAPSENDAPLSNSDSKTTRFCLLELLTASETQRS